jgi:hypothetical protein
MVRYTLFMLAVIGTAATAIAAGQPQTSEAEGALANVTVIHKNDAFPVVGPILVEQCAKEDCSDVQS